MAKNRFKHISNISAGTVGTGSHLVRGTIGKRGTGGGIYKPRGMAKGLFDFRRKAKAKYLSNEDLEKISDVASSKLAALSKHSKGMSRRAERAANTELYKEYKEGHISKQDYKLGKKVVHSVSLGAYYEQKAAQANEQKAAQANIPAKPTERATRFATDEGAQTSNINPAGQKHVKDNIKLDNIKEIGHQDEGESPVEHNPSNTLSRSGKKHIGNITKEQPISSETNLPDSEDITAKRENLDDKNGDEVIEIDIG